MKTLLKTLKYTGLGILSILAILGIYTYSLTYTPNGQQAAYESFKNSA